MVEMTLKVFIGIGICMHETTILIEKNNSSTRSCISFGVCVCVSACAFFSPAPSNNFNYDDLIKFRMSAFYFRILYHIFFWLLFLLYRKSTKLSTKEIITEKLIIKMSLMIVRNFNAIIYQIWRRAAKKERETDIMNIFRTTQI